MLISRPENFFWPHLHLQPFQSFDLPLISHQFPLPLQQYYRVTQLVYRNTNHKNWLWDPSLIWDIFEVTETEIANLKLRICFGIFLTCKGRQVLFLFVGLHLICWKAVCWKEKVKFRKTAKKRKYLTTKSIVATCRFGCSVVESKLYSKISSPKWVATKKNYFFLTSEYNKIWPR